MEINLNNNYGINEQAEKLQEKKYQKLKQACLFIRMTLSTHLSVEYFSQFSFDSEMYTFLNQMRLGKIFNTKMIGWFPFSEFRVEWKYELSTSYLSEKQGTSEQVLKNRVI